jgi:hypothetical protein
MLDNSSVSVLFWVSYLALFPSLTAALSENVRRASKLSVKKKTFREINERGSEQLSH